MSYFDTVQQPQLNPKPSLKKGYYVTATYPEKNIVRSDIKKDVTADSHSKKQSISIDSQKDIPNILKLIEQKETQIQPQDKQSQDNIIATGIVSGLVGGAMGVSAVAAYQYLNPPKPPKVAFNYEGWTQILSSSMTGLGCLGALGSIIYSMTKESPEMLKLRMQMSKR